MDGRAAVGSTNTGSDPKHWDRFAPTYDAARAKDAVYTSCVHEVSRRVAKHAPICLDAGCGTGMSTRRCANRAHTVIAVDYSYESLMQLRAKKLENVLLIQADITRLPFKPGVFASTVCANALQHLRPDGQQSAAVEELKRVTAARGRVVISVHHLSKWKQAAGWRKEGRPGSPDADYIYRFSRRDLVALLPDAAISGAGFYGLTRVPVVGGALQWVANRAFGRVAARFGLGHMLVAAATIRRSGAAAAPTARPAEPERRAQRIARPWPRRRTTH